MQNWLVHRSELTPEQLRAVELNSEEHRVIFGAPGSGKTQILLHRAAYLRELEDVSDDRFRIFVFTKVLKKYIQSAMELLDLPEESILTFDDWCQSYYKANIGARLPWNALAKAPDYPAIHRAVRDHLVCLSSPPIYDFVLVDEGQDLECVAFEIISLIAGHVTVCMDNKQQIYENGSSESDILQALGLRRRNVALLSAFRCCPYIVRIATHFISDPDARDQYLNQARTAQIERQKPLLFLSESAKDEEDRLIDIIKTRQNLGDRIAVLYPTKRLVYGHAKGFMQAGLEVEVPKAKARQSTYLPIDFSSDRPKLMPYHSAKGLTFDTVIMPRLQPGSFYRMRQENIEKLLFVGITRATKWICLCTREGDELDILARLMNPSLDGDLTVQRSGDGWEGMSYPSTDQSFVPGLDDLL